MNKINILSAVGGVLLQAQLALLIGSDIPLAASAVSVAGLILLSLRYLRDWFILSLNLTGIILHFLIQVI